MADQEPIELVASCNGSGSAVIKIKVTCQCTWQKEQTPSQTNKTAEASSSEKGVVRDPFMIGTHVKFFPKHGTDTVNKPGQPVRDVSTRYQNITFMKEYEHKSQEELRLEDYAAQNESSQSALGTAENTCGFRWNDPQVKDPPASLVLGGYLDPFTPNVRSWYTWSQGNNSCFPLANSGGFGPQSSVGFRRQPVGNSWFTPANDRVFGPSVRDAPFSNNSSGFRWTPDNNSPFSRTNNRVFGPTVKAATSGGVLWSTENAAPFSQTNRCGHGPTDQSHPGQKSSVLLNPSSSSSKSGTSMVPPWTPPWTNGSSSTLPRDTGDTNSPCQMCGATNTLGRFSSKPSMSSNVGKGSSKIYFKCSCGRETYLPDRSGLLTHIYHKCMCGIVSYIPVPSRFHSVNSKPSKNSNNQNSSRQYFFPCNTPLFGASPAPEKKSWFRSKATHGFTAPTPIRSCRFDGVESPCHDMTGHSKTHRTFLSPSPLLKSASTSSSCATVPVFGSSAPTLGSIFGGSTSATAPPFGSSAPTPGNPFGSSKNASAPAPTPGSIFGSSKNASAPLLGGSAPTPGSSLGGCRSATAPPFGSSAPTPGSTFGSSKNVSTPLFSNSAPTPGSTFGSSKNVSTPLFSNSAPTTGSIFDSSTSATAPLLGSSATSLGSIFGSSTSATAPLFGTSAANPGSIFGSSTNATAPLFGTSAANPGSIFGSSTSATAPLFGTSAANPGSIFDSSASATAPLFGTSAPNPGSIFGSCTSATAPLFGIDAPIPGSIFDSSTSATVPICGSSTTSTSTPVGKRFGNSAFTPESNNSSSTLSTATRVSDPFGSSAPTPRSSVFGGCSPSSATTPFANSALTPGSIFGNCTPSTATPMGKRFGNSAPTLGDTNNSSSTLSTDVIDNPFSILGRAPGNVLRNTHSLFTAPTVDKSASSTDDTSSSSCVSSTATVVERFSNEAPSPGGINRNCTLSIIAEASKPSDDSIFTRGSIFDSSTASTIASPVRKLIDNSVPTPGSIFGEAACSHIATPVARSVLTFRSCTPPSASVGKPCGSSAPPQKSTSSNLTSSTALSFGRCAAVPSGDQGNSAHVHGGLCDSSSTVGVRTPLNGNTNTRDIVTSTPDVINNEIPSAVLSEIRNAMLLLKSRLKTTNVETLRTALSENRDDVLPLNLLSLLESTESLTELTLCNSTEQEAAEKLEDPVQIARNDQSIEDSVITIQRHWRSFRSGRKARRDFLSIRSAAVVLQRAWRKKNKKNMVMVELEDGFIDVRSRPEKSSSLSAVLILEG